MTIITIVTAGQLGSNPRVVKEADALQAAGYDVHVISTRVPITDLRDEAVLARAHWTSERLALPPRKLWKLERALQELAVTARRTTPAVLPYAASPWTRRLVGRAAARPSDLYIAHYTGALPAAAVAARRHGSFFAFDAEDFHPGDLPEGERYARVRATIASIDRHYLPQAAYVTAASPGIADAYAEAYGISRPAVVPNVFPKSEAPTNWQPRGRASPGPSLYWFSQVIGPMRGLEIAIEAIAKARTRPHLYLRGILASGFRATLDATAERCGVADRVHLLPAEDPAEMVRLAADYDLGLVSEIGHTRNRRIAWTNKQFAYALAGVPILMSEVDAHRAFHAQSPEFTTLFANASGLADALDFWLESPERLRAGRKAAFETAQSQLNWDQESPRFIELVNAVLSH